MPLREADGTISAGWGSLLGVSKWLLAALGSLWIGVPLAVQMLVVLMGADYATGITCALIQGKWNAKEGFRGLARKILTLLLVAMAWYMAKAMRLTFDLGSTVAMAFSVNEAISVTENCARAGVPIPDTLLVVVIRAKRLVGRSRNAREVERELAEVGAAPAKKRGGVK